MNHETINRELPDNVVLSVRNVSKKFCRNLKRSMWYGIQDLSKNLVGCRPHPVTTDHSETIAPDVAAGDIGHGRRLQTLDGGQSAGEAVIVDDAGLRPSEFWALRDISFELRRGECLGLIGRNGCGKTTLLRMIAGIFPPDSGEVAIRGRVGALIALGAGFHPHMTGRENVYLNATILGLSRYEINERFDAIVDFAEIGPFIDAPVSTYSSGMRVKLGFAIAINVKADLLLVDEVLAVGDIGFKIKCLNAVRSMMADVGVVFVSHSMQFVSQFCTHALVLNGGNMEMLTSSVNEGINHYLDLFASAVRISGSGKALISNIRLEVKGQVWSEDDEVRIEQGDSLEVLCDLSLSDADCKFVKIYGTVRNQESDAVLAIQSLDRDANCYMLPSAKSRVRIQLGAIEFNAGRYSLMLSVADADTMENMFRIEGVARFCVIADAIHWARIVRHCAISLSPHDVSSHATC